MEAHRLFEKLYPSLGDKRFIVAADVLLLALDRGHPERMGALRVVEDLIEGRVRGVVPSIVLAAVLAGGVRYGFPRKALEEVVATMGNALPLEQVPRLTPLVVVKSGSGACLYESLVVGHARVMGIRYVVSSDPVFDKWDLLRLSPTSSELRLSRLLCGLH